MNDQKGKESNKYIICFHNGTNTALGYLPEEHAKKMARIEDEKTPVKALAKITKDQGGIHISFR